MDQITEDNGIGIKLVCARCGQSKDVIINRPIQFAFELADIADKAGMIGVLDMLHHRSLVFCSQECVDASKTKAGTIRKYPAKQ